MARGCSLAQEEATGIFIDELVACNSAHLLQAGGMVVLGNVRYVGVVDVSLY
jgi:hypothetical protein